MVEVPQTEDVAPGTDAGQAAQPSPTPKDISALKAQVKKLEGQLAEKDSALSESTQQRLQVQAAKEQLEERLRGTSTTSPEQVVKLQQELEQAQGALRASEERYLETRRVTLAQKGNIEPEKLAQMDSAKLDAFEEALNLLNVAGQAKQTFDSGSGSGISTMTPREGIKAGLIQRKKGRT